MCDPFLSEKNNPPQQAGDGACPPRGARGEPVVRSALAGGVGKGEGLKGCAEVIACRAPGGEKRPPC